MNDDFAALLELKQTAAERFEAVPAGEGHLFGGYTLALALRAAAATVAESLRPQSLHAYFLDPGVAGQPLTIDVQRGATVARSPSVRWPSARTVGGRCW
jgi:acyl-CoA thioesterase-2